LGITTGVIFGHPASLNQAGSRMVHGKSSEYQRSLFFPYHFVATKELPPVITAQTSSANATLGAHLLPDRLQRQQQTKVSP